MSFSRQILIFICIWGLLIYFFLIKLSPSSRAKENDEIERLNQALLYLEKSKSIDNELRHLLDEYVNDVASPEHKGELLKRISSKFLDVTSLNSGGHSNGVPSLEYELMRRRVTTNVGELWNYMSSELSRVEKSIKNEYDSQASIKQMRNFMDLAREHVRWVFFWFFVEKVDGEIVGKKFILWQEQLLIVMKLVRKNVLSEFWGRV